ncbi:hypothetical protein [Ornithinimicrobium sufpigmenti]|uniref:hypothetical protein n=1 Tax=Ornithinimicrobium sufpigmenti TaxID=2508882 RepID=UPI001035C02C|nr:MULTISPECIES: hypothetical protein [unclassified Ornithinimicrobium]
MPPSSFSSILPDRPRPRPRLWSGPVRAGLLGLSALALTACGATSPAADVDTPTVQPEQLSEAGGEPCPDELPIGDDPSRHGFGVEHAAEQLPHLLDPQEARVCGYETYDRDTTSNGGLVYGWRLMGKPQPVAPDDLPALRSALDGLSLLSPDQACTADLGPRWLVVYSHDGDLTGVLVDDYGCRNVRLTDDPHSTPPGTSQQGGMVGGLLDGGTAVLDAVEPSTARTKEGW